MSAGGYESWFVSARDPASRRALWIRQLIADVPSSGARLRLRVTPGDMDAVAVTYADPSGGTRAVRHAALATFELTVHRRGDRDLALSGSGAYEYGARAGLPGTVPQSLPEG